MIEKDRGAREIWGKAGKERETEPPLFKILTKSLDKQCNIQYSSIHVIVRHTS
jgi:hypothetical protein